MASSAIRPIGKELVGEDLAVEFAPWGRIHVRNKRPAGVADSARCRGARPCGAADRIASGNTSIMRRVYRISPARYPTTFLEGNSGGITA